MRDTTLILAFQSYNALAAASRRGHAPSSTKGQAARWRGANQSSSAAVALLALPKLVEAKYPPLSTLRLAVQAVVVADLEMSD